MSFQFQSSGRIGKSELDDNLFDCKRRESRQRVLLRALLHSVDRQSNVLVTDLSSGGLRGTTDIELRVGQVVYISLDDFTHRAGTVRWIQENRFGVRFSRPLDIIPTSSVTDTGQLPDHQTRKPRIATSLIAKISICGWSCGAKIRNVSKSGMMVEADVPLAPNQQLLVHLSNGKILTANVRWVEGDRVGIELSSPVSILQFTYGDLR